MHSETELRSTLRRLDGRSYKAYRDLRGAYRVGDAELYVDHVQGDPFAAPSRVRLRVPHAASGLPEALFASRVGRVATRDWLARRVAAHLGGERGGRGSGGSGRVAIDAGGQTVFERSAVCLVADAFEARLEVGLPAAGRRILGGEAESLLASWLPERVGAAFELDAAACGEALAFVACVENQEAIRAELEPRGLVAFVADGAILPRASGADDAPLGEGALAFAAPPELRVAFDVPHAPQRIEGTGIPRGVTLIVGGGYHGKSTLLRALERGVAPHIPGDGREGVACDARAVKIRAEDGRRVEGVDIDAFIDGLPEGRASRAFRSDDASGSTSQAASLMEALEVGARVLLLDEDTCATNFMTRDARMQALVAPEREPITPFVDRARELYDEHGVSTVLVVGSSGDFFDVATTVIEMRAFRAVDRSADARGLGAERSARSNEARHPLRPPRPRTPEPARLDPTDGRRRARIEARDASRLRFGREDVDLRAVEQLVDPSQTRAVGHALRWIGSQPARPLPDHLDALDALLDRDGPDALSPAPPGCHPGRLARPRRFEVASALNRLRALRVEV